MDRYLRTHDKSVHDEELDRDEGCRRFEAVRKGASAKSQKREPT
jgi:sarcosine oxidase delta subunit